jgi:serine protease Do
MNEHPVESRPRLRRFRNGLLASAVTLGVAGFAATGAIVADNSIAFAEPVRVEAPAPADFSQLVKKVSQAVVSVQVKTEASPADFEGRSFRRGRPDLPDDHPFNEFFKRFGEPRDFDRDHRRGRRSPGRRFRTSQGSGFFISDDGYVVTNNHVIDKGKELVVIMEDGTELDAELIGTDKRTDLALLKVEGEDFTYVALADEKPSVGEWVVAVGNPFGLGGTVTAGIVSSLGRDIGAGPYDDFIQIDAPVNRGNSGGPTFNTKGEVIGVNSMIFSPSGGNVGIAFAIPAATVSEVVAELKDDGSVTRGWLGVQIQPVTRDSADSLGIGEIDGALVADPQDDGPAEKAGIKAGDIITAVNGKAIKGPRELARVIAGYDPGAKVDVSLLRGGKERVISLELGKLGSQQANAADPDESKPEPATLAALGLAIGPNDGGDGVLVTGVDDDSEAGEKGIRAGDVIRSVNGDAVDSVKSVESRIAAAREDGRKAVLMQVESERGTRFVAVPFPRG